MEIVDCNNQVKTAANFFNDSCAVYSLVDKYNPIGDNSDKYDIDFVININSSLNV